MWSAPESVRKVDFEAKVARLGLIYLYWYPSADNQAHAHDERCQAN